MLSNNHSCFASDTFFERIAIADTLKEFSAFFPSYFPSVTHENVTITWIFVCVVCA